MRLLTAGESHGPALTLIIEGLPAGIPIDLDQINESLARRQSGYGRSSRQKLEKDTVIVLGGAVEAKTYGGPLCLMIKNRDDRELFKSGGEPRTIPRPGHVDLPGSMKYGLRDLKIAAERASGRLTALQVAAGSFARGTLRHFGIDVLGWVIGIGDVEASRDEAAREALRKLVESSPVRCPDGDAGVEMMRRIDESEKAGDTLGGLIQVTAWGVPPGLGSFGHWDRKLDGMLARAVMSIPGIKGVEIGEGFSLAGGPGSKSSDEIYWDGAYRRRSNFAGGIEGGVSNGSEIILRAAMKPIPTVRSGVPSVDILTKKAVETQYVRSDTCAVPAASLIAESAVSMVLFEVFLEKFHSDNFDDIKAIYRDYLKSLESF